MSVKTVHKEYKDMLDVWQRCRDASEGQSSVHKAGISYLPALADQSTKEYDSYKQRASFFNATWRTISGLQGMLFRKPSIVEVAAVVEPMLEDVDLTGQNLHMFALEIIEECLTVGRVGIFVDYPTVDQKTTTEADSKVMGLRPILKQYPTESIINWRKTVVNNASVLSMVVLSEETYTKGKTEFDVLETTQYRVLDLALPEDKNEPQRLIYRVRVFTVNEKDEDVLMSVSYPQIKGKYLEAIPFYTVSTDSIEICPDEPPLIDLVDINLSHYRTNADYEHGCHFTGLPTPVISGYTPDTQGASFAIGSMTAWVFPRPDAKASYLEFTGQGLKALEANLARKEAQMVVLGARMLENKGVTGDSQGGAAIHMGGEQSLLASISQAASIGIERALTMFSKFAGTDQPAKFRLNKDFFPMPMSALSLTALVAAWQNGAINYGTLFDNLQKGEIVDIDQTVELELAKMNEHTPPIPAGTKVNQTNTGGQETTLAGSSGNNPTQRQLQTPPKA